MANLSGTNGNDTLRGTEDNDTLNGFGGDDLLFGYEGNDVINMGSGDDRAIGADGNDFIRGEEGYKTIFAGFGNDTIRLGFTSDTADSAMLLNAGEGRDVAYGGTLGDNLRGEQGNDILYGGFGSDRLVGGAGDDVLDGGYGTDRLLGGVGNDTMIGGAGVNLMSGESGNDTFVIKYSTDGSGNEPYYPDQNVTDIFSTISDFSGSDKLAMSFEFFSETSDEIDFKAMGFGDFDTNNDRVVDTKDLGIDIQQRSYQGEYKASLVMDIDQIAADQGYGQAYGSVTFYGVTKLLGDDFTTVAS